MGNCLAHKKEERKVVKLVSIDDEVLEYPSSLVNIREALSEFHPGHTVAGSLPVFRHLEAEEDLLGGSLYYLLPPKMKSSSDQPDKGRSGSGERGTAVRIKVVVSKQELKEMLSIGEAESLGKVIAKLHRRMGTKAAGSGGHVQRGSAGIRAWRPALESIPEGNDS